MTSRYARHGSDGSQGLKIGSVHSWNRNARHCCAYFDQFRLYSINTIKFFCRSRKRQIRHTINSQQLICFRKFVRINFQSFSSNNIIFRIFFLLGSFFIVYQDNKHLKDNQNFHLKRFLKIVIPSIQR